MSSDSPEVGTIAWIDLTVENAADIRDFYKSIVGWRSDEVAMGEYNDFNMLPPESDELAAGICHARGSNTDLPVQWLLYFVVEDVDESATRCAELGGEVVTQPRAMGGGRFCVVRDPAGAVCALYSTPPAGD
jgi:predicted enzyme related to lactoylglutathione lyase